MRQRIPLVLSATALLVAVFGSTPVGQAARHVVGEVVPPFAKTAGYAKVAGNSTLLNGRRSAYSGAPGTILVVGKDGKLPTAVGAVGPAGPKGDKGPKGDPGLSGVHLVTASQSYQIPSEDGADVSAFCPKGEVVTGGGGLVQLFNAAGFLGLVPVGAVIPETTAYFVEAGAVTAPAGGHITVNAWAVCATAAS